MKTRNEIYKGINNKIDHQYAVLEVLLDIRDSLTEKKLPEPVTFGPISGSDNPFKPEPEKTAESWEKKFDEKFPYKIQGSPKHTPLRFIDREIKAFIDNLLTSHTEQKKEELIEKIEKLARFIDDDIPVGEIRYQCVRLNDVVHLIKEL